MTLSCLDGGLKVVMSSSGGAAGAVVDFVPSTSLVQVSALFLCIKCISFHRSVNSVGSPGTIGLLGSVLEQMAKAAGLDQRPLLEYQYGDSTFEVDGVDLLPGRLDGREPKGNSTKGTRGNRKACGISGYAALANCGMVGGRT